MPIAPSTVAAAGAGMLLAYALDARQRIVALRSQLPLISSDAPTAWVHVAYDGSWEGHESGPFEFTQDTFAEVIANFERQLNAVKLDFDHETVFSDGAAPARGWVHRLEVRKGDDDDPYEVSLWALVEFGPEAVSINRDGGYRFCSGVFEFDAVDRVTGDECGCELTSLALTDSPFIDGQRPIQLSRRVSATGGEDMKITKAQIRALNLVKKATLVEVLDQFPEEELTGEQVAQAAEFAAAKDGTLDDKPKMAKGDPEEDGKEEPELKLAEDDDEDDEDKKALAEHEDDEDEKALQDPAADAALAAIAPLLEGTGLDVAGLTAALAENLDAVLSALAGALQEPAADAPLGAQPPGMPGGGGVASLSLRTTQEALGSVTRQRDKLAKKLEGIERKTAEDAVEAYVHTGHILDNARPDMVALYRSNRDGFNRIVASMKPTVSVGEHAGDDPPQESHPAISEADAATPEIKSLRRMLSATKQLTPAQIDNAVRERIASRRETAI